MIYEYKCKECGEIIEIRHKVDSKVNSTQCPKCKKNVEVEKLISKSTFTIHWDKNY